MSDIILTLGGIGIIYLLFINKNLLHFLITKNYTLTISLENQNGQVYGYIDIPLSKIVEQTGNKKIGGVDINYRIYNINLINKTASLDITFEYQGIGYTYRVNFGFSQTGVDLFTFTILNFKVRGYVRVI